MSRSDKIASVLLWGSLIAFAAFHFLPFQAGPEREGGWIFWAILPEAWMDLDSGDWEIAILLASFLCCALLLLAAPFLIGIFKRSKVLRILALLLSVPSTVGLAGFLLYVFFLHPPEHLAGPAIGMHCLVIAQILNLLGLCFIRRPLPVAPAEIPATTPSPS